MTNTRQEKGIPMNHAKAIGRLGMLAVGLGIGAALAATPGIASADSNAVDAAAFDPSALIADATPADSGLNLAISIDGFSLFQSGTATANSATDDIAVAYGSDSAADAGGYPNGTGTFDYAFADGTYSNATAALGNDDSATAIGTESTASSGTGNGDTAYADGTSATAFAGGSGYTGADGNDDYASAIGNNDIAWSGTAADYDATSTLTSTGDIATIIGNSSDAYAGVGDSDFAGVLGDSLTSTATDASNLFDLVPSL